MSEPIPDASPARHRTLSGGRPGSGRTGLGLMLPTVGPDGTLLRAPAAAAMAAIAERGGFAALWTRDVPLLAQDYPDRGPFPDPWVWLGLLAGATRRVLLGTAGVVLPLRHPLHVAKAAASLHQLSGGRMLLGLASGDRPAEYAAFGRERWGRAALFRNAYAAVTGALRTGAVPVPEGGPLELTPRPDPPPPVLVVGGAGQTLQWTAANAQGWVSYPRDLAAQRGVVGMWRQALAQRAGGAAKPFVQSLNLDLADDPDAPVAPLSRGIRAGRRALLAHLEELRGIGVDHVILNPARGARPAAELIEELATDVAPAFAQP